MHIKQLLKLWEGGTRANEIHINIPVALPLDHVARILALEEMYPGHAREQIIIDLLEVALDELEEAFPYVKGERVIREDEFGDPVYEDIGKTPRFLAIAHKYREQLQAEHKLD